MAERRWRRCRRRKAKLSHCDVVRFLMSIKHREGRSVHGGGGSIRSASSESKSTHTSLAIGH
ncbi:DNA-polymerase IV [Sesbania bispinosa]|nr:DNA-polymerase IV [Sesbania bispinosa]